MGKAMIHSLHGFSSATIKGLFTWASEHARNIQGTKSFLSPEPAKTLRTNAVGGFFGVGRKKDTAASAFDPSIIKEMKKEK